MPSETDRIEKEIVIDAPREKVWRALTDAREFGAWFGVKAEGTFEPGARVHGQILSPEWAHVPFEIDIDRVDKGVLLAWRWAVVDSKAPTIDLSKEPKTYVSFELSDTDGGTRLKVIESGFDALPEPRRDEARRQNADGWTEQVQNIKKYAEG